MRHDAISREQFARTIDELSTKLGNALATIDTLREPQPPQGGPVTESAVRDIIRRRRKRDKFFSSELFGEPAWDMLLELYAAELGQRRVSVTSLCIASAVPATTALRWIAVLQREGLVDRADDPLDGRRVFISLSEAGVKAMGEYLSNSAGEGA